MAATSGYSKTPLVRKLGIKSGMRVRLLNPPDDYWGILGEQPDALKIEVVEEGTAADLTHLFATRRATLDRLFRVAKAGMKTEGAVWASWPKKASDIDSEVRRGEVMAAGKRIGLVDVKVCAVDDRWSALKFVIPVDDRP